MTSNFKGESRTMRHHVLGAALLAFVLLAVAPARRANAGPILTRGPRRVALIPAPVNLTNTLTKDVCTAHGGSAGSLACAIALPAGKLVLVWDYPYPNAIDGFHVYRAGGALVATQSLPSVHLAVLDPQPAGTCFDVTAFKGKDESTPSPTQYCVRAVDVPKTARFQPDVVGSAIADFYVWANKSFLDNEYANRHPFVRDLLTLTVGHAHEVSLWRDTARTQVSQWTDSLYWGYVHFSTPGLAGHQIARATLRLSARGASTACVAEVASADRLWKPGQWLGLASPNVRGGPYQGPQVIVDVTPIVQGWADSPAANKGFALADDTTYSSSAMVTLSTSCLTFFSRPTLVVTYY
jgi:hypothetical protein